MKWHSYVTLLFLAVVTLGCSNRGDPITAISPEDPNTASTDTEFSSSKTANVVDIQDAPKSQDQSESESGPDESESASSDVPPWMKTELAPPAGYNFQKPRRLKAGGEFISVEEPGYACPTMADVDVDGDLDLVVGQFSQGHMQFCENTAGAGELPTFAVANWIQSGSARAIVPGVW